MPISKVSDSMAGRVVIEPHSGTRLSLCWDSLTHEYDETSRWSLASLTESPLLKKRAAAFSDYMKVQREKARKRYQRKLIEWAVWAEAERAVPTSTGKFLIPFTEFSLINEARMFFFILRFLNLIFFSF